MIGVVGEEENNDPANPVIPARYLYTPYGEAHIEKALEVRRSRFEEAEDKLGSLSQTVEDPEERSEGALIVTFAAALDANSLAGGVVVERNSGAGWVGVAAAELMVGFEDATELKVLERQGWERGANYRVRLTTALKDKQGRGLDGEQSAEWKIAADGFTSDFDRSYAVDYDSITAAKDTIGGRFPGGQNGLFQGLWTDPVIGISHARARWLVPREGGFVSEDPLLEIESSNLYAFVGWEPQTRVDPQGLTSKSAIWRKELFYTFLFGWIDTSHAGNGRIGLKDAWNALQVAPTGARVQFSLQMDQNQHDPSSLKYKLSKSVFVITVADSKEARKGQLLYAFRMLSEQFETHQDGPIQGNFYLNRLAGLKADPETFELEKIASSYSTEDMFSNYLAFVAEVENVNVDAFIRKHGGYIEDDDERIAFSYLMWNMFPVEKGGSRGRGFRPILFDEKKSWDTLAGATRSIWDFALDLFQEDHLRTARLVAFKEMYFNYKWRFSKLEPIRVLQENSNGVRRVYYENVYRVPAFPLD